MKQVLVIGTVSRMEAKRQPVDDLLAFCRQAVGSLDEEVSVYFSALDDLVHVLDGPDTHIVIAESGKDIADFDFVWLRGRYVPVMNEIALIGEYLERRGANFANHSYAHRSAYGKNAQMHLLASLSLPYPKTVYATGKYAQVAFMDNLPFPMIVKNNHGSHGEKNYLVKDADELKDILGEHPGVAFVAQEFIPNNSDYRILIVGGQQLIIERTGSNGSHLNNTSQGGSAVLIAEADFPAEVIAEARKFARALHYEMSGVDVLFSSKTGKHYFLEANSQPQIISGAFVEEKQRLLSDYLAAKLAD